MKKRRTRIILFGIFAVLSVAAYMIFFGSKARRTGQDRSETKQVFYREGEQSHILIAYFTGADNMPQESLDAVSSASVQEVDGELVGNTELVAMRIQEKIHGDLFSIRTNRLYSHNYTLSTIQAWGEQTLNVKPRLVSHVEDFEEYDVVFLGYPAWWMDVPIAIESFLSEYNFAGKTVVPFTTHVSSGLGSTVEKIQDMIPEAEVLPGISIQENECNSDRLNEDLDEYYRRKRAAYFLEFYI